MRKIEQLPPVLWDIELEEWQGKLKETINSLKKRPSKVPKELTGRLKVDGKKRGTQFYYIEGKQKNYFSNKQKKLIQAMIQEDYNRRAIDALEKELTIIRRFLKQWRKVRAENIYTKMVNARKELVWPLTLPAPLFASEWQALPFKSNPTFLESAVYQTLKGEKVRSKSEVLIADALYHHGIPYHYESQIQLHNRSIYPDFTCINLRTRQQYIWEHFGMMDDMAYLTKNIAKLEAYQQGGFFIGHKLIISMETKEFPLTPQKITGIINEYLV